MYTSVSSGVRTTDLGVGAEEIISYFRSRILNLLISVLINIGRLDRVIMSTRDYYLSHFEIEN
jgi:hypothetical protein